MGRRSLADQLWETYRDEKPGAETWLIIYDFQESKPTSKFYDNINRIKSLAVDGELIQFSVYKTSDQRAAKAIRDLVEHYGGQVQLFKGEQVEE